jgi:hypothetical protein
LESGKRNRPVSDNACRFSGSTIGSLGGTTKKNLIGLEGRRVYMFAHAGARN